MLAHISRKPNIVIGGRVLSSLFFNHHYSSTASAAESRKNLSLENFLVNTLGYSEPEAIKLSKESKVSRSRPITKDFSLVVDYLKDLGFVKTQIRSIVTSNPNILFNNLDKTLKPKIRFLHDLGLSGSVLVKVLMQNRSLFSRSLDSYIKPRIGFLRNLVGSDDNVVMAVRRCTFLLRHYALENITETISALKKVGFSNEKVGKLFVLNPRSMLQLAPEKIEEIGNRVENDLGIPAKSKMFFHGFLVLSSYRESTIDLKLAIFRSYGWSDLEIYKLLKTFPRVLTLSEGRIKEALNFVMKELGYNPGYLASHHTIFSLSLETRVKPRYEVLKILDQKELRKRKTSLYYVVCLSELKFIQEYLLPYKNDIPDVYESYIRTTHQKVKIED